MKMSNRQAVICGCSFSSKGLLVGLKCSGYMLRWCGKGADWSPGRVGCCYELQSSNALFRSLSSAQDGLQHGYRDGEIMH